jgi:heme-degrading monooxygenase HmoA
MHARLFKLTLGPGARDVATGIADKAAPIYKTLDGFVSVTFLIFDEEAGSYGSLSVWKSEAAADAAADKLNPWLAENYGSKLKGPPEVQMAEVYEPA